ncbi:Ste23p [Sugiyamaella lignohabitans]|uniref:Ste23p n=1 Tax=Sugiyamaella lignohabitans TaxID=796027 RepID=A0A167D6Z0_9ASCO|nr:Ste23p [Sugiyamaella lignohabitans]ANB12559.1 Ste23p [Sugiyamaella lignohabitans]
MTSSGIDSSRPTTASIVASNLEKPLLDERQYRVITLPNKLEALLINDVDTDKASAALDVNVGSYSDPNDLYGLAHFCEHLLFMGTEKYPSENEYSQYLSEHSGSSNAYTSSEETNYFFEVAHDYLEGALDRFAQFFICPLFSPDCKDREIRAVDSENKKNLQSDSWRLHQLDRSLSNPHHVYNKFSTGNLTTLNDEPLARNVNVRDELLKFHQQLYSANLMKLVIVGRESLDTLEEWVVSKFSAIRNIDIPRPHSEYHSNGIVPLTSKELGKIIRAKPVMDTKHLVLTFPVPDQRPVYTVKPSHYFSHLIGHEGPGSLLHYFKQREWANSLSAGSQHVIDGTDFFVVDVELTTKGLDNYEQVLYGIFEYLKLLELTPPQSWIFDELKEMTVVDFKFKQKTDAIDVASRLATVLQRPGLPREHLLSHNLMRDYRSELISDFVTYLNPDNFRAVLTGQSLSGLDKREKWYGTEYSEQNIDPEILAKLKNTKYDAKTSPYQLPAKNEFIPTNFAVNRKERNSDEPLKRPNLVRRTDQVSVWHKKDDTFWVPKARVYIKLTNPFANMTPSNSVKTGMFVSLINDALVEFAYNAEVAGLRYEVATAKGGIEISVNGYNDKILVLIERILEKIKSYKVVDPSRFEVLKEKSQRSNQNFGYTVPYNQIGQYTYFLLNEHVWHIDEKSAELDNLELQDMQAFIGEFVRQFQIEILAFGNITKEEALKVSDLCVDILRSRPLAVSQRVLGRSYLLPPSSSNYYNINLKDEKNVNSCIDYTMQVGLITEAEKRVTLELLAEIAHEPAFNQLRTKEQLGYVVFGGVRSTRTTMGYRVLVQSERTTDYLEERIDQFLYKLGDILEKLPDADFKSYVEAVIVRKLEKRKNLSEESNRYWTHIQSGYYNFLKHESDVEIIRTLKKEHVIKLYNEYINPDSPSRSKLVVHLKSQSPPVQSQEVLITTAVINLASKYNIEYTQAEMAEMAEACQGKELPEIVAVISAKLSAKGLSNSDTSKFLSELNASVNPTGDKKYPEGENITDVGHFKSRLALTEAPTPLFDLSMYQEQGAKL